MNRKLLNGLLVAAIAAGGVGTFTSCKDENFSNDIQLTQSSLQAQIDAIRGVTDSQFQKHLEEWLDYLTDKYSDPQYGFSSYQEAMEALSTLNKLYDLITKEGLTIDDILESELGPFVNLLYNWIKDGAVAEANAYTDGEIEGLRTSLQQQIDTLKARLDALDLAFSSKPSSIEVSQVYNPVFGSINLPVGINSTVMATYVYEGAEFNFPAAALNHLAEYSPLNNCDENIDMLNDVFGVISDLMPNGYDVKNLDFTASDGVFGNMGGAVLAVNPTNINLEQKVKDGSYTVELVTSDGKNTLFSTADEDDCLDVVPFEDKLYFGYTREGEEAVENSDLYALQVSATPANYKALMVDIDKSELKDALKQAVDNKSISNIAHLGEVMFKAVNNKLPAYAVKLSWEDESVNIVDGAVTTTSTPNSLITPFNLAATVVHPLSYGTMIDKAIPSGKRLPVINPLVDYLERIQNKIDIKIELDEPMIEDVDIQLRVVIQDGFVYPQHLVYDETTGEYTWQNFGDGIKLNYDEGGILYGGSYTDEYNLQQLVNAVLQAAGIEMSASINNQVLQQLKDAFSDINMQIQEQLESQVGRLQDYIERIKESKKLTYAQKLVDIYNDLAGRVNDFLADPNHYLQVMMAYSTGDGAHHMSNDVKMPVKFNSANGSSAELITTSYTGDVVVPSFKKYVAITEVVGDANADLVKINNDAIEGMEEDVPQLNKVYDGTAQKVLINLANLPKNQTLRLTYVSVDYRGQVSMENYYMMVY